MINILQIYGFENNRNLGKNLKSSRTNAVSENNFKDQVQVVLAEDHKMVGILKLRKEFNE